MNGTESLRVIIVDDEPLARAVVREYLAAHPSRRGRGVRERLDAVKAVSELSPHSSFSTCNAQAQGFESSSPRALSVISDAYDQYSLRAFEVHAVDYLRNRSEELFAEALSLARSRSAHDLRRLDVLVLRRGSARDR